MNDKFRKSSWLSKLLLQSMITFFFGNRDSRFDNYFVSAAVDRMESPRPPTYAAISSHEDYGATNSRTVADEEEASPSGTFSAAASPYWNAPIQKAADKAAKNPSGFSPFVAFCFTINYILGAGFLTIPWAFAQSGLVLSSIMLIVSAVGSDISKNLYVHWSCIPIFFRQSDFFNDFFCFGKNN